MKHLSRALTAVILAVLMATLLPAQVFADTPDYISEVKIGIGKTADEAKASLEGYTILDCNLNENAGASGVGSNGNRAVYLGYKTTTERKDAITDLALMNMKGGYDVNEYDILMEKQLKSQIIPFVENYISAIDEYRANYKSKKEKNYKRAKFTHDMLNYYIDDDTGKRLGDLLLNKTKYEMGDKEYNALSENEKKNHADILTIISQANGQATLAIENLITRASDTNIDTWIDRFVNTDYNDMIDETGKSPTDARKLLAKKYDDDASLILEKWNEFYEELLTYDEAVETVKNYDASKLEDIAESAEDENEASSEDEDLDAEYEQAQKDYADALRKAQLIKTYEELSEIEYQDGTMLDFFMLSPEEIEDDITVLYPLVASLSDGQRAGLDFVSLKDLVMMAVTTVKDYENADLSLMKDVSVFAGVNRAIYQKGGVALTSDTLRTRALEQSRDSNDTSISKLAIAFIVISGISVAATLAVGGYAVRWAVKAVMSRNAGYHFDYIIFRQNAEFVGKLAKGFALAAIIITTITLVITFSSLNERYKTDFTPIPQFMIDEKDLIGYNSKGEKIILKNQAAYYEVVRSNLKKGDFKFSEIGNCADLNGCVGAQWLALYAAKNIAENPILANSLTAVKGNNEIPAGYKTGIHMFGTDTAFNLNTYPYVWNSSASSIYVYFKRDDSAKPVTSGTNLTTGVLALAGGGGLFAGAAITALGMTATKKRKEDATQTA